MARIILFLAAMVWLGTESYACDQCGCALSNTFGLSQHHIGYRFRYRRLFMDFERSAQTDGPKHLGHLESEPDEVKELYYVHELFGNYHLGNGWSALVSLPLVNNYRSVDASTAADVYGFGDPWLMLRKQFEWSGKNSRLYLLMAGVGVKLPVGEVQRDYDGELMDLDMQPGSGSMDESFQLFFQTEGKKWIFSSSQIFRFNGRGENDYRYGHALAASLEAGLELLDKEETRLYLTAGPYMEWMGNDAGSSDTYEKTLFAQVGVRARYGSMVFQLNGQSTVAQDYGAGRIPTTQRVIVGVQYDI